jgi:hypothetical protein
MQTVQQQQQLLILSQQRERLLRRLLSRPLVMVLRQALWQQWVQI